MEKNSTEEKVVSAQKVLESSHEPGWNDPPKWAYSPTPNPSNNTPRKRLLNKRVAFPLNSQSLSSNQIPPSTNLSPLLPATRSTVLTTAPHAPLLAPSNTNATENLCSDVFIEKDDGLNYTLKNFESVITNFVNEDAEICEVRKRLDMMKSMWMDDKLCTQIHQDIFKISNALRHNDVDTADRILVSLMLTEGASCQTWVSGIRHLILSMKEKMNLENSEKDDRSEK